MPSVGTYHASCSRKRARHSSSMMYPCSTEWAPRRNAALTAPALAACAMTLRPRWWQIANAACSSLSVKNECQWRSHARTHDPAGEIELDVIDTGLDVLADGAHEPIGTVTGQREAGAERVAGRGREEPAARVQTRADVLPRVERPLERDVDEVRGARHPHAPSRPPRGARAGHWRGTARSTPAPRPARSGATRGARARPIARAADRRRAGR